MISNSTRLLSRWRSAISDLHPIVDRTVSTAVPYYAMVRVKQAKAFASIRYDAPIDPRRLYAVDPNEIERTVSWTQISTDRKGDEHPRFQRPKYRLAGRVFGGEWDRIERYVADSTIYRSLRRHFEDGVRWEETQFYDETLAAIDAGQTPWDCRSRSDLDQRCAQLDRIYERIAADGYKTQNELYELDDPNTSEHQFHRMIWCEIGVHVGRDGESVLQDGRNRLAIAQILGLESVPVVILVRHEQWQRTRDRVASGELERSTLPEQLRDHPDLSNLF